MTDPTNKPDTAGTTVALARVGELPYLGDKETVDGMLRTFVGRICARYVRVSEGAVPAADASQADMDECRRFADIFLGRDEGYSTVGPWNGTPLADACRTAFKEILSAEASAKDEDALAATFALLVHAVYDALRECAMGDSEEAQADALNAIIDDWGNLLIGVPPSNAADNADGE